MNPIKVFISIFAFGLGLALILGILGLQQGDLAQEDGEPAGDTLALDLPASMSGCLACHGQSLEGVGPNPPLINVDLTQDEIIDILENGLNAMPAQTHLSADEMQEIADYLVSLDVDETGEEE